MENRDDNEEIVPSDEQKQDIQSDSTNLANNVEGKTGPNKGDLKRSNEPEIEQEILRNMPPEVRETFLGMFQGPMANPLHAKVESEHITELIRVADESDKRQANAHRIEVDDRKSGRHTYALLIAVLCVILVVGFIMIPTEKLGGFEDITKFLIGAFFGAAGGYGIGSLKNN